jgi:hypothetical protein
VQCIDSARGEEQNFCCELHYTQKTCAFRHTTYLHYFPNIMNYGFSVNTTQLLNIMGVAISTRDNVFS